MCTRPFTPTSRDDAEIPALCRCVRCVWLLRALKTPEERPPLPRLAAEAGFWRASRRKRQMEGKRDAFGEHFGSKKRADG